MSAHTPGPWFIGKVDPPSRHGDWDDAGGYRIDADGVEQLCYAWNASHRIPLSGVQSDGPPFGSDNGEANARLIAAAPELLGQHEADMTDLELLAKAIHAGDPMPELVIRITDMLNRKRSVIAKATGATP